MSSNETKQENKHSPAPWVHIGSGIFNDADGLLVCRVGDSSSEPAKGCMARADFDLIAASPELLGFACFMRDWLLERRSMGDVCISYDEQHRLLMKSKSVINQAMGS